MISCAHPRTSISPKVFLIYIWRFAYIALTLVCLTYGAEILPYLCADFPIESLIISLVVGVSSLGLYYALRRKSVPKMVAIDVSVIPLVIVELFVIGILMWAVSQI